MKLLNKIQTQFYNSSAFKGLLNDYSKQAGVKIAPEASIKEIVSKEVKEELYKNDLLAKKEKGAYRMRNVATINSQVNRISYFVILALLIFVLVFAREIKGSTRWIDFGFFQLQPAEFAKIVVILGLSRWMYLKRGQINSWKNIIITAVYTLIPAILIMREPDLGSSVILIGVWAGLLLISPMSKKYIVTLVLMAVILSGIGWQFGLHDYQQRRIEVFLNPDLDPRGQGYNVRQAIIAVGSGQLFGRGLGQGLQGQLNFLPERQTDFIFASASEEIGFLGVAGLLALYCFLFLRLLSIMKMAKDDLAFYIVGGVLFLVLQVAVKLH
jgi:rod shape determining protein RodA